MMLPDMEELLHTRRILKMSWPDVVSLIAILVFIAYVMDTIINLVRA
ncbi:MAG: hypothetical protein WCT36_05915 [Candidatus Gracilibacteria bacterium]